jgi:hypothetical protein
MATIIESISPITTSINVKVKCFNSKLNEVKSSLIIKVGGGRNQSGTSNILTKISHTENMINKKRKEGINSNDFLSICYYS